MSASEASVTQYRKRCNLRWSLPKLAVAARICSAKVSMFFSERQPSGDKAYIYIPPPSQARKREMARSKTVGGKQIADAVCQAKGLGRAIGAQTRCRGGPPWL